MSSNHNENLTAMGARAVSPDSVGVVIEAVSTEVVGTDEELCRVRVER